MSTKLPIDEDTLRKIEEKRQRAITLRKIEEKRQRAIALRDAIQKSKEKPAPKPVPVFVSPSINKANEKRNYGNKQPPITKYFTAPSGSTHGSNTEFSKPSYNPANASKRSFTQLKDQPHVSKVSPPKKLAVENVHQNAKKYISMSVLLLCETRFVITCPYDKDLIEIFRKVPTFWWDPKTKRWSFLVEDYFRLFQQIKTVRNVGIRLENSIPETVIKALNEANQKRDAEIDLTERLEGKFVQQLFDFQKEGIKFAIRHEGRCLIADDMGLGKTIQSISIAMWYREDWPLLVVCPASLRHQWKFSFLHWVKSLKDDDIFIVTKVKDIPPRVPITIASYDSIALMASRLAIGANSFYKMIILDESHYIKSETAKRTEVVRQIADSCNRILLLSGTPALSRPIELFSQVNLLSKTLFPSRYFFGLRYCDLKRIKIKVKGGGERWVDDYKGSKNLDELRILLESTIMIRRLKRDVLDQLPSKTRQIVAISTDDLKEKEKKQLTLFRTQIKVAKARAEKGNIIMQWFRKSAEVKIGPVSGYLLDMLEKDIKLICFCHHKVMMDGVEEVLNKNRVNHIRIDGSTSSKSRQEACTVFQNEPKFKVALLSITACATGLNLTAATMVIFAEMFWNPGVLMQAEDRVHRIGQLENVNIVYLVARHTIDELMWPLISKKLDILNKAGLSRDTFENTANPLNLDPDQRMMDEFVTTISANNNNNAPIFNPLD